MAKTKRAKPVMKKAFTRAHFEMVVGRNKITIERILEMHNLGLIGEHDYFFTLEGVKDIATETGRGFHANCRQLDKPHSLYARDKAGYDAREIITNAFT